MATAFTSYSLVPELQHWFHDFVVNSVVNRYKIPAPVDIDTVYLPQKSFVEMLFNENYSYDEYRYLYTEETRTQCWPTLVRMRLCIYAGASKYMLLSETPGQGDNIFGLESADLTLLDALLAYRTDGTGVTIVDSTATIAFDSTSLVLTASFNNLPTPLSKLIYLYLELKLYGRYQNYNNLNVISTDKVLDCMFELVLIDEYFKFMTAMDVNLALQC